jgi:hypothetical protein
MDEKNPGPSDIQNDEKVPLPIVVVDDEEKVILRKIDLQSVSDSPPLPTQDGSLIRTSFLV